MKKFINLCMLCMVTMCIVACNKETPEGNGKSADGLKVSFMIDQESQTKAMTKASAGAVEVADLSELTGIEGLKIFEEVTSLDDTCCGSDFAATKGTPVYTQNVHKIYSTLLVTAYHGDDQWGLADRVYTLESGDESADASNGGAKYSFNYSSDSSAGYNLAWPDPTDSEKLTFYIQSPSATAANGVTGIVRGGNEYGSGNIHFSFEEKNLTDPTKQYDHLFTSKVLGFDKKESESILLYHPFVGVKFKAGDSSGVIEKFKVTKIEIKNVVTKGSCTVYPQYDSDDKYDKKHNNTSGALKSADCVEWTYDTKTGDYVLNDCSTIGTNMSASKYKYGDHFDDYGSDESNYNDADYTKTFFIIPQKLGADAVIKVSYKVDDSDNVYTAEFNMKDTEWKAGELHTYTITMAGVGVDVRDNVNADTRTKSNVKITNTGYGAAYIRAAIVANWMDANGKIYNVAWTLNPNDFKGLPGTDWVKGSDGYYYYKHPVQGGKTISFDLFTSYTAPNLSTTTDTNLKKLPTSAHLEMSIITQAVQLSKIAAAQALGWGSGVTFLGEDSIDNGNLNNNN